MIAAYVGAPGDCKTYSLVHWLCSEQRRRRTVSQFGVDGCYPLQYLSDLLHERNHGAAVGIDEVGRILPARDWRNEDDVESVVLETHRHYGLDIRYCVQDVMQASVSLRRLTEYYIYCYRVGPDPSRLLKAGLTPRWWQCPYAVRQVWIHHNDMADGAPKAPEHRLESKVRYIWWTKSVAGRYDTTERLYYEGLQAEIDSRLADASERLAHAEPWRVVGGHSLGQLARLYRARDYQQQGVARGRARKKAGGANVPVEEAGPSIIQVWTPEGSSDQGETGG